MARAGRGGAVRGRRWRRHVHGGGMKRGVEGQRGWAACRGWAARTMRGGDAWTGAGDAWEGAGTWEGGVKGGGGGIYRVAATRRCTWGRVGGVQDAWIAAVVGWLHGQPVGGEGSAQGGVSTTRGSTPVRPHAAPASPRPDHPSPPVATREMMGERKKVPRPADCSNIV